MLNNTYLLSPVTTKLALYIIAVIFFFAPFTTYGASTSTDNLPVRLKIPYIGIDVHVEPVGVNQEGAMIAPEDRNEVGWFQPGIRPGEIGNAVIAGHYGWKSRLRSAFDNLHTLHIGDKIYIEDDKGAVTAFVVRDIKRYGVKESTAEVFFSNDGKRHLNLITCDGRWNAVTRSYSSRLVVFTDVATE